MSFSNDVRKGIKNIEDDNEKIVKLAAIELFKRIIFSTPVGNPTLWKSEAPPGYTGGSARNNWFLSFKTPSDRDDRAASGRQATESIKQLRLIERSKSMVYILTNNLPYIERLEKGWSQQAPAGMLRKNVKNWDDIVNKISRKVRR